tara:strand:- start:307 stop:978 length:672 start_codon:yes stop_codon:yes gene_type:complete
MMASPSDFEDFGVGFTLSEGLVESVEKIESVSFEKLDRGVSVNIELAPKYVLDIFNKNRNIEGRTGCGICGINEIDNALRPLKSLSIKGPSLNIDLIFTAIRHLPNYQTINKETGSVHAAGFFDSNAKLIAIREDVGRHNALDKLIGNLARKNINTSDGFIVITSRCSMEMVQKTISIGCPILVSVSAPTSLAIEIAKQNNLTVLAFAREEKINIYTDFKRII